MKRSKKTKNSKAARTTRRALTADQERAVAKAFVSGESQGEIAERLGVGVATVGRVLRRLGVRAEAREAAASGGMADPSALELYRAVGLPPLGDTLGSSGWMHRALIAMAAQAMTDSSLTEKQRRKDMVALARASTGAFPLAVIDEATKLIGKERGLLKSFDRGPETVSRAELDAADRAAGRPPSRSVNAFQWEGRPPEELDS